MGSSYSFGIDSFSAIDDTISSLIFHPPQTDKNHIKALATKPNYFFRWVNGIVALEIKPKLKQSDKVLIFSHGNASDVYTMHEYLEHLANSLKITVVCYDYPGYGLSLGEPDEETCNNALETIINYYATKCQPQNIILVGQSLGTGVVMHYVSTHTWNTPVILISPYKSLQRVICDAPIELSFRHNTFSTLYKLEKVTCPVKIFHGKHDKLIDCSHSEYIYKHLPNKTFLPSYYEGIGHNDILRIIGVDELLSVINFS